MPTISIQKTDGCQVYLSKDSLNAEFITSKSSTMNILVPSADGDFVSFFFFFWKFFIFLIFFLDFYLKEELLYFLSTAPSF